MFKNINDKSIPGNVLNSCLDIITIWNISENSFGSSCSGVANEEWIITNNIYFIKFTLTAFFGRRPGVRFLKSANFLKVILNHITLGGHMEGDSRLSWYIKEKKSGKMVQWVLLVTGCCLSLRLTA